MSPRRLFGSQSLIVTWIVLISLSAMTWTRDGAAETDQSTTARAVLGSELAKAWCTQCHSIGSNMSGTVQSDVPSFHQIANRPGQSAERIAGFLIDPHPPMPNFNLSRRHMVDLASYIMSLKQRNGS